MIAFNYPNEEPPYDDVMRLHRQGLIIAGVHLPPVYTPEPPSYAERIAMMRKSQLSRADQRKRKKKNKA